MLCMHCTLQRHCCDDLGEQYQAISAVVIGTMFIGQGKSGMR
jgi:hypothetical protein